MYGAPTSLSLVRRSCRLPGGVVALLPHPRSADVRRGGAAEASLRPSGLQFISKGPSTGAAVASSRRRQRKLAVFAVFERFTERAVKGVLLGQKEAKSMGFSEVCTEHILLGLVAEEAERPGKGILPGLERTRKAVAAVTGKKGPPPDVDVVEIPFSKDSKRVFENASNESRKLGNNYIAPEHILVALLSTPDILARKVFEKLGVDMVSLKLRALKVLKGERESETVVRKKVTTSAMPRGPPKALEEFCTDLCEKARQNRVDPVIGREKEVTRVVQILARRSKNNPILIGEPGVGKTAIAEGLANAIVTKVCPDGTPLPAFLEGKRVMQMDIGLIIAGAKERGELESRISKILADLKSAGNIILMIDEIHTLVGAGAVGGRGGVAGSGLDISNMFKPALARGDMQCIGATTLDEHRRHIEKDAALERRFQPVYVGEPSEAEAKDILQGLKERYETYHQCVYEDAVLDAAVTLAARYVPDRQLPDKAIDLLDEAGSRARITADVVRRHREAGGSLGPELSRQAVGAARKELQQIMDAKSEAIKGGHFEEAALLRVREVSNKVMLVGAPEDAAAIPYVSVADIESIVAQWTGIPVQRLAQDDQERLLHLDDALRERVIGQDEAVTATARAMRRAGTGLRDPRRPIGAMLFCGPTGVGKTELTRVLADHYFGSADAMLRLDMSEYMERHSVSKLVGAPPGYVGYGEAGGGRLTEAVRRRPFGVLLLDEVEKAHPDVFNILLQVLEEGRLTDSQGRTVSFRNTLVVMTSNIGSALISGGGARIGFVVDPADSAEEASYGRIKELVTEELKNYFRPELLNRMDEVVVFRQLGRKQVRTIADLILADTARRTQAEGIALQVTAPVMAKIVDEGYDKAYGARPLRRAIARLVEDVLADAMLNGRIVAGDTAVLDCSAEGEVFVHAAPKLAPVSSNVVYSSLKPKTIAPVDVSVKA